MRMRLAAAAGVLALAMAFSMPAFAQYVGGTPPSAGPNSNPGGGGSSHLSHSGSDGTDGQHQSTASVRVSNEPLTPQSRGFPVTGADILQLVVLAGACTIGGVVLVRGTRRRTRLA